jgi:hypothetical protein
VKTEIPTGDGRYIRQARKFHEGFENCGVAGKTVRQIVRKSIAVAMV